METLEETGICSATPTGEDCVICLSAIADDCVRTPCGHHFHQSCLDEYLHLCRKELRKRTCDGLTPSPHCPLCRSSLRQRLAVHARAASGLPIEVTAVPEIGQYCHFDRGYTFESLGGFQTPGMLFVATSDGDRLTPATDTMWILEASIPVTVYLNFRSMGHIAHTGVQTWLVAEGWQRNHEVRSTMSTGMPNGPHIGPVYSRAHEAGTVMLRGSNTWKGTYLVFVKPTECFQPPLCQTPELGRLEAAMKAVASPCRSTALARAGERAYSAQPGRNPPDSLAGSHPTSPTERMSALPVSPATDETYSGSATTPQSTASAPGPAGGSAWSRRKTSMINAARNMLRLRKVPPPRARRSVHASLSDSFAVRPRG